VWGFYRLLFQVPDPFDELLVKPVVWLIPVFVFLKKEKLGLESLGITMKKLFPSIYFALALGVLFALEGFYISVYKGSAASVSSSVTPLALYMSLGLSFITGVSEEIAFRGFIFNRLSNILQNEWYANLITSVGWTIIHVPQVIFDWHLNLYQGSVYLFLIFLFGFGASFIFSRTKNIIAPILLHIMWAWPILLFR
jgi:membrane protease YdiL (CAAX protease family)